MSNQSLSPLGQLQNGSDVRGVALEQAGGPPVNLTPQAAGRIAAAYGLWLAQNTGNAAGTLRVGVGTDSRLTAEPLKGSILSGLAAVGIMPYDCGMASTPAMYMSTVFPQTDFDGAIMVTASHLPKNRNGMKFFTRQGGLDKGDISALLHLAEGLEPTQEQIGQATAAIMDHYTAFLREKIVAGVGDGERPLAGLHIVVDAGNGAGGFFATRVLEPLGADCTGSQFLEPDGTFPNHQPNPENQEAMASICGAVRRHKADLGIIFDTDVDRMSAVLSDGSEVNRNAIIALLSAILAPEYPGATIVTDSVTSDRLTAFLEQKLGLHHHCYQRGYKNVINEAIRLNQEGTLVPLAIETSGHGALQENYFLDDGAYMAVRIVVAMAKARKQGNTLTSLLDGFAAAEWERECRIPITGDDFAAYGKRVLEQFHSRAGEQGIPVVPSHEGVRLSFGTQGWALLRMSLHDPLLPLNVESDSQEHLAGIVCQIGGLLEGLDQLDLSVLG